MKIGLSFDLKNPSTAVTASTPDDSQEEYDSFETIQAIAAVLEKEGHEVVLLGGGEPFLHRVLSEKPDFVFNISEGVGISPSREAQVPTVLEMLRIPYSGSEPQCLGICLDKALTKRIVSLSGVRTAPFVVISRFQEASDVATDGLVFPLFAKPLYEGSSKGIRYQSRLQSHGELVKTVEQLLCHYHQPVLVEPYLPGADVTVGLLGNSPTEILGVMRILPKEPRDNFFYSLEVKRDWERLVTYESPPILPRSTLEELQSFALSAFATLGCRDVARVDFRLDAEGRPHFLEINALPGLSPVYGDLVIMARMNGISFEALIRRIFLEALKRTSSFESRAEQALTAEVAEHGEKHTKIKFEIL